MKKSKYLFFVLLIALFMPIFSFACNEKTITDVPYTASTKTIKEVFDSVKSTKTQMISEVELKMDLTSQISFQFYETAHGEFDKKNMSSVSSILFGKNSDNPSIVSINTKNYEDKVLLNREQKTYIKQTSNLYQTSSFCYTLSQTYKDGKENEVLSTNYLKQEYNPTIITFLSLYNTIVYEINSNCVDNLLEKTYENVTYYKLSSDIDGLENLKNIFTVKDDFSSSPKVFCKNAYLDYITSFNCEFGLMETEGSTYLKTFSLNYSIVNANREKYLDVSVVVKLNKYGNNVVVEDIEDKGEYSANTFMDFLKQDNSYCVYNQEGSDTTYSVLQLKKSIQNEDKTINYFDYSVKKVSNTTEYYYLKGVLNSTTQNIEYLFYKLSLQDSTMQEVNNFDFAWLQFNFNLPYSNKNLENNVYYQFGSGETYIKVRLNENGDVSTLEKDEKQNLQENVLIKLNIQSFGLNNKLNLISSLDNFSQIN